MTSIQPLQYEFFSLIDKIAIESCTWIEKSLFRLAGSNWWNNNVLGVLNADERQKIKDDDIAKLQDLDIHVLLKILERNYKFLRSKLRLPADGCDLVYNFRQIRNRTAHRAVRGMDVDSLFQDIQSLESFCSKILASKELCEESHGLLQKVKQLNEIKIDTPLSVCHPQAAAIPLVSNTQAKSLREQFSEYELTKSQTEALDKINRFLCDDKARCFVLNGYAGTGKTFLVGGIVKHLDACHIATVLMAPTGRAAHVIKERHNVPASTIHRLIYSLNQLKEFREVNEEGALSFKFYFDLRYNKDDHDTVFIVDEASMVSDVCSEAEFMHFGSGRLLRDLLEFINFDANEYRKKIIFIGDKAQLHPVNMSHSPALDVKYLEKYIRASVQHVEMTEVVRQKEEGLVLENATNLRNKLINKNLSYFDFKSDGKSVVEIPPNIFVPHYLEHVRKNGVSKTVIIGYSNNLVKDYNTAIRNHLFPNGKILEPQDRVMVVKNNYKYEIDLFNGQIGTVVEVGNEAETRSVPINSGLGNDGERINKHIGLKFRKATIRFEKLSGATQNVTCLCIENLLQSTESELPSDESKALYVDFKIRNPDLNEKQEEFKQALLSDVYFNALRIKHAYAVTCHKAQGGEWPNVYIDFHSQNKLNEEALRWSYTALTRASENVVCTNALHHSILTPIKSSTIIPAAQNLHYMPTSSCKDNKEEGVVNLNPLPSFLHDASEIDKRIYFHLLSVLPAECKFVGMEPKPYQSHWKIQCNGTAGNISVNYNGKNYVSSVSLSAYFDNASKKSISEKLQQLKGRKIDDYNLAHEKEPSLPCTHAEFYAEIKRKCESLGINLLVPQELTQYHIRCSFGSDGKTFSVNFYFDARKRFKSFNFDGIPSKEQKEVLDKILDIKPTTLHV